MPHFSRMFHALEARTIGFFVAFTGISAHKHVSEQNSSHFIRTVLTYPTPSYILAV